MATKTRIKYGKALMMSAMKFSSACNTRWGPCPLGLERGKYFGFDINEEECPFEKMRYSRCDAVDDLFGPNIYLKIRVSAKCRR